MFRRNQIGPAVIAIGIVLGFSGPPPAAYATSMSLQDISTVPNTLPVPLALRDDAASSNALAPPKGRELWGPRSDIRSSPAESNNLAFGGAALAALIAEDGLLHTTQFTAGFDFDPSSLVDWYRFSSDYSFELEFDDLLDIQAIAVARYRPDVQYWLEGNRWAYFDSSLPMFQPAHTTASQKSDQVTGKATRQPFSLPATYTPGGTAGNGKAGSNDAEFKRVFSLSDFLLNMLFKLAKLPITYVILAVCIGALVISYYRQPRT